MTYQDSNIEFLPKPTNHNFKDITGQRFGRLLTLGPIKRWHDRLYWLCQCDCGKFNSVQTSHLVNSDTQSCGCLLFESRNTTHKMTDTPEYNAWLNIKARCHNPNNPSFSQYGARGITVCEQWRQSFETFLTDMGLRPSSNHSLERIDNTKNYEPTNCKWGTRIEQANNRRNMSRHTFQGKTQTVPEWCRELHLKPATINRRLREGWAIEQALTIPVGSAHKSYVHKCPHLKST